MVEGRDGRGYRTSRGGGESSAGTLVGVEDLTYPLLGLGPWRRRGGAPSEEAWDWFRDPDDFRLCETWKVDGRVGMLIFDSTGRCWRITSVHAPKNFWRPCFPFVFLTQPLEQELVELPPLSFGEVQDRFCSAIQNNPDYWRDDEAIAGEDGPPRDEQELLDEMKAQVMRARNVPELISNLWEEDLVWVGGNPPRR